MVKAEMIGIHHVFTINDQKHQCPYCAREHKDSTWDSFFESVRMYKTINCDCGKFLTIPIKWNGSGHDSWDGKHSWKNEPQIKLEKTTHKMKTLEQKIEIAKVYSMHP
jgi:hypothetical protein